ncbi:hypothetical protein [Fictibacillus sp. JL2B1089]|uniref:hypothetical protein n=1 Tax=Fictibacillus sp. JL2B1089 TaxID=3399565 RepID=UPI003A83E713
MATYTTYSKLYKWNQTDTKLTTITEMGANTEKIDNEFKGRGINPEWFGLDSDKLDNYQPVVDTINHIKNVLGGRGKIVFPAGKVFKFNQALGSFELSNIMIDFNGSTLDFSSVPPSSSDTALMFSGTFGSSYALTADLNEGSTVVQINSTAAFKAGDMVKAIGGKVWDSTRTSTRCGEILFVKSIDSPTQMTLTIPVNETYTVAKGYVFHKINPVENVVLMNGTFIGASGDNEMRGIRITRGYNILIENMRTKGFDVNHFQLTDCVRFTVDKVFVQEANHAQMAYGVSVADACQDGIIINSHFTDVRHSFSTNNNVTTSWGITRRILFAGNTVNDSSPAIGGSGGDAIDTHAGAEDIWIINNEVFSSSGIGINCEANRAVIRNNKFKCTGSVGIQWQPYADGRLSSVNISDNVVESVGDGVGSDYGILCTVRVSDADNIIIGNNEITSQNASIRATTSNGYRIRRGTINGNNAKVLVSGYGVEIINSDSIALNGNSVEAPNFGIGFTDSHNCTATGNTIRLTGASGSGYGLRFMNTSKRNAATGNSVKNAGTLSTSYGLHISDSATYNMLLGNVTDGFSNPVTAGVGTGNVAVNNI